MKHPARRVQAAKPSLHPGDVRARPKGKNSQAHPGVSPLHPISNRNTSFQPLPRPLDLAPYHYDLAENFPDIAKNITKNMTFHVVGDTGGVLDGEFQNNVAQQMIDHLNGGQGGKPLFCYHVGDVVYFTGMHDDYYAQFYDPYAHYEAPIFSIPGNHDGEVDDPSAQTSLDGWVDYFMQAHPDVDPISKDAPRVQLNLPNVYWTLTTPMATIVGMYTNCRKVDRSTRPSNSGSPTNSRPHRPIGRSFWRCITRYTRLMCSIAAARKWRTYWKMPSATPAGCPIWS
jgi:hypothetical protein